MTTKLQLMNGGFIEVESAPLERDYLWRHAFAYADCHTDTDSAADYATHYVERGCDHVNGYYPDHGPAFADWRDQHDN